MHRPIDHTINRTIYNAANRTDGAIALARITANDLKTRGIAAIEASLSDGRLEAIVSVRGADRYVVMEMAQYQHLRECELDAAIAASQADVAAGRYMVESPADHVARLQAMIAEEASTGVEVELVFDAQPGRTPPAPSSPSTSLGKQARKAPARILKSTKPATGG